MNLVEIVKDFKSIFNFGTIGDAYGIIVYCVVSSYLFIYLFLFCVELKKFKLFMAAIGRDGSKKYSSWWWQETIWCCW